MEATRGGRRWVRRSDNKEWKLELNYANKCYLLLCDVNPGHRQPSNLTYSRKQIEMDMDNSIDTAIICAPHVRCSENFGVRVRHVVVECGFVELEGENKQRVLQSAKVREDLLGTLLFIIST